MGKAVPVRISRHTHPKARPDATPPPAPTGIDYLGLVAAQREAELLGRRIDYAGLASAGTETMTDEQTDDEQGEQR